MPGYRLPLIWTGCIMAVVAAVMVLHGFWAAPTGVSLAFTLALGIGSVPTARHIERATRSPRLRRYGIRRTLW